MDVSNSCLVTKPLPHIVILVRFTTAGFQLLFQDHWKVLWSLSVIPLSRFVIVFKLSWNLWPKGNVDHGLGAQTWVEIYSFPLWGEAVAVTWSSGSCPFRRIGGGQFSAYPEIFPGCVRVWGTQGSLADRWQSSPWLKIREGFQRLSKWKSDCVLLLLPGKGTPQFDPPIWAALV